MRNSRSRKPIADTLRRGRRLLCAGAMIAAVSGVTARAAAPKLTVGIFIDGLEYDKLVKLKDSFGKDGFARFMEQGVVIPSVDYGTALDATAATAVAVTGASPSVNGIASALVYDPEAKRLSPVLSDPETMGNFTSETYSPKALLSSTLSDEAKIAGGGVGYSFSIACDPERAILLAGHASDGAIWLNGETGKWAGSTYYGELPPAVVSANRLSPMADRLDTMSWTPAQHPTAFAELPDHLRHYPFRYVFPRGDGFRYEKFAASPLAAREITRLARELITGNKLGTHEGADAISISFSVLPYEFTRSADSRYEHIDSYLKADKAIKDLIETAERQAGKGNCLFYIVAAPSQTTARRDDEKWRIPYGEFSVRKAMSLLNMYLMALYGNGDWVTASDGARFYLNRETIKSKNLNLRDIRRETASILNRMSGIRSAFTIDDILEGKAGEKPEALKRNTPAGSTFDVMVSLRPGWTLNDDFNYTVPRYKSKKSDKAEPSNIKVERLTSTHAPAMILSPELTPRLLPDPIDARHLAPTLARIMGIRAPNGAETAPITLQ